MIPSYSFLITKRSEISSERQAFTWWGCWSPCRELPVLLAMIYDILDDAHLDGVDNGTRVLVLVAGDGVTSLLGEGLPEGSQ